MLTARILEERHGSVLLGEVGRLEGELVLEAFMGRRDGGWGVLLQGHVDHQGREQGQGHAHPGGGHLAGAGKGQNDVVRVKISGLIR